MAHASQIKAAARRVGQSARIIDAPAPDDRFIGLRLHDGFAAHGELTDEHGPWECDSRKGWAYHPERLDLPPVPVTLRDRSGGEA